VTVRDEGFTLVELLVALTVLALLMVLLFGGLRFGTRAWEQSTRNNSATEDTRSAQMFLRKTLERACPRRVPSDNGTPPAVDFSGTPQSLEFLAPAPQSLDSALCARMRLSADTEQGERRLTLSFHGTGGKIETHNLIDRAADIEFAYFGDRVWQDNWSGRIRLPVLIRIRVRFARGSGQSWPELFITPRISAETDCVYDPATKTCQGS
jgi:general secretion pathway protein J